MLLKMPIRPAESIRLVAAVRRKSWRPALIGPGPVKPRPGACPQDVSREAVNSVPNRPRTLAAELPLRTLGLVARPLRFQPPGGIFHVFSRGNRRQPIFLDDRDYAYFLALVAQVVKRYRWRCHAYCLMPNHFHLLIETPSESLSVGMHRLNSLYAQYFNRRHDFDGHLFQGRFGSVVVRSEWHLIELSRYIVLNPVRAGLCARPEEWRWSSYRAAVGSRSRPTFLTTDFLLSFFGSKLAEQRAGYAAFVREGLPWSARDGPVL
jgi:REP element-mobilizing transposase RayT